MYVIHLPRSFEQVRTREGHLQRIQSGECAESSWPTETVMSWQDLSPTSEITTGTPAVFVLTTS